jgi:hypothetical protein
MPSWTMQELGHFWPILAYSSDIAVVIRMAVTVSVRRAPMFVRRLNQVKKK